MTFKEYSRSLLKRLYGGQEGRNIVIKTQSQKLTIAKIANIIETNNKMKLKVY